jgi:hypothetical protein
MSLIKKLQTSLPRGAPIDTAALKGLGISAALAHEYVRSGWLIRLGRGVFMFAGDRLERDATLGFLARRTEGLHVAARTALEWHGFRQNLAHREVISLRATRNVTLPEWFLERFPARCSAPRLFSDGMPPGFGLAFLPELPYGPLVSVPERALLEMLSEVGVRQEVEEARSVMESVRQLRTQVLTAILQACLMRKAVRLCVTWSAELGLSWADVAARAAAGRVGTGRWIRRLKDGRTLILKAP